MIPMAQVPTLEVLFPLSGVAARMPGTEMEDWPVYSVVDQWAMPEALGNKDCAALGEQMLFVAKPQFDFSAQVRRVFWVGAKECQNLVEIVRV